jgi:hypothetical protein
MNRCRAVALYSVLSAACLYGIVIAPSPGFVRYGGLPIQTLYGVSGNLVLAGSAFGVADAISFSDTAGLIAANGSLKLFKVGGSLVADYHYGSQAAPLLGTEPALNGAIAFMSNSGSLLWWHGETFTAVPVDGAALNGKIDCISLLNSSVARLLIARPEGSVSRVDIGLPAGNIISSDFLPDARGAAFQVGSRLLWSDKRGLEIEASTGMQHTLSAPSGSFVAEEMSSQWTHLYFPSNGTHWALHLGGSEPSLSRLPSLLAGKEAH